VQSVQQSAFPKESRLVNRPKVRLMGGKEGELLEQVWPPSEDDGMQSCTTLREFPPKPCSFPNLTALDTVTLSAINTKPSVKMPLA
jgi:hypothetical protein